MLKLILIAGIWINPMYVYALKPVFIHKDIPMKCRIIQRETRKRTPYISVDLPCNEVAAIINKEIDDE